MFSSHCIVECIALRCVRLCSLRCCSMGIAAQRETVWSSRAEHLPSLAWRGNNQRLIQQYLVFAGPRHRASAQGGRFSVLHHLHKAAAGGCGGFEKSAKTCASSCILCLLLIHRLWILSLILDCILRCCLAAPAHCRKRLTRCARYPASASQVDLTDDYVVMALLGGGSWEQNMTPLQTRGEDGSVQDVRLDQETFRDMVSLLG